jgi:hypothetical protein
VVDELGTVGSADIDETHQRGNAPGRWSEAPARAGTWTRSVGHATLAIHSA